VDRKRIARYIVRSMSGGRWSAFALTFAFAAVVALAQGRWYWIGFLGLAALGTAATVAQIRNGRF
jgi:hypothetical protein